MICERIKNLRKRLNLTQQEFGESIGIKRNSVALIEAGRNASNQTILSICREFHVNEEWLRNGTGEMFVQTKEDDELTSFLEGLAADDEGGFKKRLIGIMAKLTESQWAKLEEMARVLCEQAPPQPAHDDVAELKAEIAALKATVARYAAQSPQLDAHPVKPPVKHPVEHPVDEDRISRLERENFDTRLKLQAMEDTLREKGSGESTSAALQGSE